jgi:hypothetical protein
MLSTAGPHVRTTYGTAATAIWANTHSRSPAGASGAPAADQIISAAANVSFATLAGAHPTFLVGGSTTLRSPSVPVHR